MGFPSYSVKVLHIIDSGGLYVAEIGTLRRDFTIRKFRMWEGPHVFGVLKILRFGTVAGFDLMHSHGYKGNMPFGLIPKSALG